MNGYIPISDKELGEFLATQYALYTTKGYLQESAKCKKAVDTQAILDLMESAMQERGFTLNHD